VGNFDERQWGISVSAVSGFHTRVTRRIARDSELYGVVPDSSKPKLEDLIAEEVSLHIKRRKRKVDWSSVATLVMVAAITGGLGYALAWAALEYSWLIWFIFAPVTLFGFLLSVAGSLQLFIYPNDDGTYPVRQRRSRSRL
jgi:siroheme synthase (precorrin-2 oxidase/ferrochelatase)